MPVTVFEQGPKLSEESRASTFHPPTLDMLHALGAAEPLIAQGLKAPAFQYRTKKHGLLAEFDFAAIADATAASLPGAMRAIQAHAHSVRADARPSEFRIAVRQRGDGRQPGPRPASKSPSNATADAKNASGRYLIGADGASSAVRRSLGIEFEGFTWPDRLLVVSTPFDFYSVIPGLSSVSYVADPERWYFLLQIPGLWRVMFLVNEDASDERVQTPRIRADR